MLLSLRMGPSFTCRSRDWIWWRSIARRRRQAYPGSPGHRGTWERTKTRVKAMRDMAQELLQALRRAQGGAQGRFPADNHWQREFEDAFEFEETA